MKIEIGNIKYKLYALGLIAFLIIGCFTPWPLNAVIKAKTRSAVIEDNVKIELDKVKYSALGSDSKIYREDKVYISPEKKADFKFHALGVKWDEKIQEVDSLNKPITHSEVKDGY